MKSLSRWVVLGALVGSVLDLSAQGRDRGPLPLEPGDSIPTVSGFTADGEPIALESLKGHFTVIAFGCLT